MRMDGTAVELDRSGGSDKCGVWVEVDGTPVIEESGTFGGARLSE
jgi:hypothetical protein